MTSSSYVIVCAAEFLVRYTQDLEIEHATQKRNIEERLFVCNSDLKSMLVAQNMLDQLKETVKVASLFSSFYFCHITVSSLICNRKKKKRELIEWS